MTSARRLMSRHRQEMKMERCNLPDIPVLGRYNYTQAQTPLREHTHERAMEICFLVKGRQTYRLGGQNYRLKGGDVFVAYPGEQHSTGGAPEEKGILYWLALRLPPEGRSVLGLPAVQSRQLIHALRRLPRRHFEGGWKMKEHLDAVTILYHDKASALRDIAVANHVLAFLLEMVACGRRTPAPASERSLAPVLRHIAAHLGEPMSVPHLAGMAGLSTPRFKARFKEEMGLPPGEYVLRARIEEATRLLASGRDTVTGIAYALGFSSSQYFATVFRRFTGKSPREFLPPNRRDK